MLKERISALFFPFSGKAGKEINNIEKFFLNMLLKISIVGVFLILVSNILFSPEDMISIFISLAIFCACILAYLLRNKHPTASVILVTSTALVAMSYQRLAIAQTSTTLAVILIVGFIFSALLKGRIMWLMHGIAFIIINTIFVFPLQDAITAAITYSTLYFILTYATGALKSSYDRMNHHLKYTNCQLQEKATEITLQNEELLQVQEKLNMLNNDLERMVNERTAQIQIQHEILIKYSFANAHHLRGPVARLLGLAYIHELDPSLNATFIIEKMVDQAHEIDSVVKRINIELNIQDVT